MSIHNIRTRRSIQSIVFEQLILLEGSKKTYSNIHLTEKLVQKNAIKNKALYELKKIKLKSTMKENSFENMQVFIINNKNSTKQLYLMGDSAGGNISLGLTQLLSENKLPQPKKIKLFSACVDRNLKILKFLVTKRIIQCFQQKAWKQLQKFGQMIRI